MKDTTEQAINEYIKESCREYYEIPPGFEFKGETILFNNPMLVGFLHPTGRVITQRYARIFKILLEDARTRADINLLLISAGYPPGPRAVEDAGRMKAQRVLAEVLDGLFAAEPVLRF